jgi:hypothetical protein
VRAILLGDAAAAQRISPVWASLDPGVQNLLEAYLTEKSPDGARFAAIYLLLMFPGTRPIVDTGVARSAKPDAIDGYRNDGWCIGGTACPGDPSESPEALYLVVRVKRYGYTNKTTGGLSPAAFQLLHAQYPNTEWAERIEYGYGDGSCI